MTDTPIIYQIYVDAFARGSSDRAPGRQRGGDLEGATERLDYIASLGADAIWLTPIFSSPSDHGYNITDYFHVDSRLAPDGDDPDELFGRFVDRAHELGLGILLDLPLNHVGHGYDLDQVETATPDEPPRLRPARTRQERGWQRDLKYLDHDHPPTRRWLFDVARYWIERYRVDGYRYDYVHGIGNEFWADLYTELERLRPGLFVVGEYWEDIGTPEENARDIASRFDIEGGRCFDTLFDFPFQAAAVESLAAGTPTEVVKILDLCERSYPRAACAMLDNHDTARIGDWLHGDPVRQALALRLLASRTGPISVLYGTETCLVAGRPPRRAVDESSRIPMNWDEAESDLVATTKALFEARRKYPAITEGTTEARAAIGSLFVERKRGADGSEVLTVLNFSSEACATGTDVSPVFAGSYDGAAICGGDALRVENGVLESEMPAFGGGLYVMQ